MSKCSKGKPRRKCSTPGCNVTTADWYPVGRKGDEVACANCFELRLIRETRESMYAQEVSEEDDDS